MARIATKRWNDPVTKDDGTRLLVTRYRPRGLRSARENWDEWLPQLAPSKDLHAAAYGKTGEPIPWETYRERYLQEMRGVASAIAALAERARSGEPLTLLCSSACTDPARCHRTLLRTLLYEALGEPEPPGETAAKSAVAGLPSKLADWLR